MKNWLLYFICVAISVVSVPIAADRTFESPIPSVSVSIGGNIIEMSAEEFALRVLLAESEHCQNTDTKKALAVSARSCALYLSVFGCKHTDFDVCDSSDCCFSLGDPETANEELLTQCENAVNDTYGMALTLDSLPAMALFTLCAGSGTGNCEDFTYLTAVSEPARCETHVSENTHELSRLQILLSEDATFDSVKESSVMVYAENGKCAFGVIDGKYIPARDIADTFSLESTEFSLEFAENGIKTTVYGIGHGYGMSLCGADKMANAGKSYEEILENYYPDLILNKMYHN